MVSARWLVAGTAGGVGTTTLTALLFSAARARFTAAPQLADHTGGTLAGRLADDDQARAVDPRLLLHDLGPHAHIAGGDAVADRSTRLVVVAAATPIGCAQAASTAHSVSARHGHDGLRRSAVCLVGTFGRHRISGPVAALRDTGLPVVIVPVDQALAVGGHIAASRVGRTTWRAVDALLDQLVGEVS